MTRTLRIITPLAILLALLPPAGELFAEDLEGSRDHPMLSRMPGSEIGHYEQEEFGQVVLPLGKAVDNTFADTLTVEGKVTRIAYRLPADRGPFETWRQYREALVNEGFEILWTCERVQGCGSRFRYNINSLPGEAPLFSGEVIDHTEMYYLAARLSRPEGNVYAQVLAYPVVALSKWDWARVRVLEERPMEAGLVTVDAAAMQKDLERAGRVAIYGITFDHDSADIRAESGPTLDEMAKLLNGNTGLSVFIVGHTDSTGALGYNMDLSRRRAAAVVDALVERGIAGGRLDAHGVGPLSPVDTNDSEEGRARNRRVEMVKRTVN